MAVRIQILFLALIAIYQANCSLLDGLEHGDGHHDHHQHDHEAHDDHDASHDHGEHHDNQEDIDDSHVSSHTGVILANTDLQKSLLAALEEFLPRREPHILSTSHFSTNENSGFLQNSSPVNQANVNTFNRQSASVTETSELIDSNLGVELPAKESHSGSQDLLRSPDSFGTKLNRLTQREQTVGVPLPNIQSQRPTPQRNSQQQHREQGFEQQINLNNVQQENLIFNPAPVNAIENQRQNTQKRVQAINQQNQIVQNQEIVSSEHQSVQPLSQNKINRDQTFNRQQQQNQFDDARVEDEALIEFEEIPLSDFGSLSELENESPQLKFEDEFNENQLHSQGRQLEDRVSSKTDGMNRK